MRLTIIHPCIGRKKGHKYIRGWQMEPLAPAVLASLTPSDVEVKFYDDRMEPIPYEEPTDLVAISVETYTARRAYQIASTYRRRGVPVVMGGFHATLIPEEVSQYAEAIVIGEAENLWQQVIKDFRAGGMRRTYESAGRPSLQHVRPDRSIFKGKRYLPIGLVEAGRGCHLKCEFCAIQSFFGSTQTRRSIEDIVNEVGQIQKPLIFFVDDNFTSNMDEAKELMRSLIPLKIKWVSQASIHSAHDEEFLRLARESGCQGLLIGFETLNPKNLKRMGKTFNMMNGGYENALANLRKYGIRLYATFMLGYDEDDENTFEETVRFAKRSKFFMVSFNHVTPFPGTPLYERLKMEKRLLYDSWWLDPDYSYGMVPFTPKRMPSKMVQEGCVKARKSFYSLSSILRRSLNIRVNTRGPFMVYGYFLINALMRKEVTLRENYPLGDEAFDGPLVKADHADQTESQVITNDRVNVLAGSLD